ncbi:MAG: glycoside hydrolase family 3 C-terminal domain-containing protein [Eubacteriales bacterium]
MRHVFDWKEYAKIARQTVADGCVLLRNEEKVLPLQEGATIAIFGRTQFDYLKSGTGSGGLVNAPYVVNIVKGLEEKNIKINQTLRQAYEEWLVENPFDTGEGWSQEPWFQKEMELSEEFLLNESKEIEIAIVVIGRQAGEDRDNKNEQGSYLLTDDEHQMMKMVTTHFQKVVVLLNVGNIIDMNWVNEYKPQGVVYIWQGGCEGGNGVADLLVGDVNPSGKLTDTIAERIEDHPSTSNFSNPTINIYAEDIYIGYRYFETFEPEKVMYPFGFGLSYTTFLTTLKEFRHDKDQITIEVEVSNTGEVAGKEVVQVYVNPPQGVLGKPIRNLIAFGKTKVLEPEEAQIVTLQIDLKECASYDDGGLTGEQFSYVLEAGTYEYYVGSDVRIAQLYGTVEVATLRVTERLTQACAPVTAFHRMKPVVKEGQFYISYEKVPLRREEYHPFAKDIELEEVEYNETAKHYLIDVYRKIVKMDDFISQLSDLDMIHMARGEGMSSPKVTLGTAGAFGGVTDRLKEMGIPMVCCSDGPSGIRMDCGAMAFSLPNGAILASTFDVDLCTQLYEYLGMEMNLNHVDTLLGPGINIHRNPLNGRNFEYFSEDPFLTGKMAIAQLKGMHKYDVTGTLKHFACNSQEYKRADSNSVLSERALREIYWKAFEMAVKEGGAYSIMTSYGGVNGIWSASNYDMLTIVLRGEWGFQGSVMTDWWAKMNEEGGLATKENATFMIKAQNDVYMVTECAETNTNQDNVEQGLEAKKITRAHLVRNTKNLLNFMLQTPALRKMNGRYEHTIEEQNRFEQEDMRCNTLPDIMTAVEQVEVDCKDINTSKATATKFYIQESGIYEVVITTHANLVGIAQVPMTVYNGNQPVKMVTLNESRTKAITKVEMELVVDDKKENFVKLFFGEGGTEVDSITIRKM